MKNKDNPQMTHSVLSPRMARMYRVLDLITAERMRQRTLLRQRVIFEDCADPKTGDDAKLCVLTEELGEVAKAIDCLKRFLRLHRPGAQGAERRLARRRQHLQTEIIQTAAVAVAWAESLEEM